MRSAVIVGAGIGGLAAAIALRRAGWDVRVVEQAESPRELGFALALAPNALAALGELGLKDAVLPRGVEIKSFEVRRPDGRVAKRVDLHGNAVQSIVLLRPALHGVLLDTVGSDALILSRRVIAADTTFHRRPGDHEIKRLSGPSEPARLPPDLLNSWAPVISADSNGAKAGAAVVLDDGTRLEGDVVVGADGVGSVVRRALHPGDPPPRPSGYHALRGVSHDVGDRLGTADCAIYLGDGVEIGFARASASAVYWYISLVDALAAPDPAETLERCTRGLDPAALAITHAARPGDIRADRLFYMDPLQTWGAGRVTLLGDAAHPLLPHTAQGAALALEDAVALGLALRDGDVESRLRFYERVRAPRTRKVVRTGPRIAAMTTTRSRMRIAVRDVLTRLTPAGALAATLTRHARDPHGPLRG